MVCDNFVQSYKKIIENTEAKSHHLTNMGRKSRKNRININDANKMRPYVKHYSCLIIINHML